MARIGVYVCGCGGNISDVVDVDKVAQFASAQPNVVSEPLAGLPACR